MSKAKPCPACEAETEQWWSYCAMCGWHIASGEKPLIFRDKRGKPVAILDPRAMQGGKSKTAL